MHAGDEPVHGPDVGQDVEVRLARKFQAPVALAVTHAARQALGGVAELEVRGVEVRDGAGGHRQRHGVALRPRVVPREDPDSGVFGAAVDDPREPFALSRAGRGQEQRDAMHCLVTTQDLVVGYRRQVRQVPGGALQEAGHQDWVSGRDLQLPLAGAVSQRTVEALAGFEFLGRDGA